MRVYESLSAGPPLYICQHGGRGNRREKRDKLVPKGRPFTFGSPPPSPALPRPIQVLCGILKCSLAYSILCTPLLSSPLPTPFKTEPQKCCAPHSAASQSASKRSFVSTFAHSSLLTTPLPALLLLRFFLSVLFFLPRSSFLLIVCLLNDTDVGYNSQRLVHPNKLVLSLRACFGEESSVCILLSI